MLGLYFFTLFPDTIGSTSLLNAGQCTDVTQNATVAEIDPTKPNNHSLLSVCLPHCILVK